jgi:hypothetical protein
MKAARLTLGNHDERIPYGLCVETSKFHEINFDVWIDVADV